MMYYPALLHFNFGVRHYVHIVRGTEEFFSNLATKILCSFDLSAMVDVRTMHHEHMESDPHLYVSLLGQERFARAIGSL